LQLPCREPYNKVKGTSNKTFPETISQGVVGGPEFLTDVVSLRSGGEYRETPWTDPIHRYDAGLGIRSIEDLDAFQEFFYATRGMLKSFRFKDWSDYRTTKNQAEAITPLDETLGVGDGTTYYFRTYKTYGDYSRRITNPRAFSARVAFDGSEVDTNTFFVDDQNGTIVFLTPPPAGVNITCGFEFDIPVRFDSDYIPRQLKLFNLGSVPNIPIVEVRYSENIVEADYVKAIEILEVYPKETIRDLHNIYDYTVNRHWGGFWELANYPVTT